MRANEKQAGLKHDSTRNRIYNVAQVRVCAWYLLGRRKVYGYCWSFEEVVRLGDCLVSFAHCARSYCNSDTRSSRCCSDHAGCVVVDRWRDLSLCDGIQYSGSGRGTVGSVGRAGIHIWRRLHALPSAAGRRHAYAAVGSVFPGGRNLRNRCVLPITGNERIGLDVI